MKKLLCCIALLFCTTIIYGQRTKINEKDIVGIWKLSSVTFKGESRSITPSVYRIKFYCANGEYACCEILSGDNDYQVLVHEYGTYSYKGGKYIEMGRNTSKITQLNKTDMHVIWETSNEHWKRIPNMSNLLKNYILNKCRANKMPASVKKELDIFKKTYFK